MTFSSKKNDLILTAEPFAEFERYLLNLPQADSQLLSGCIPKIESWLRSSKISDAEKIEIIHLVSNGQTQEIRDRFYKELEFGTGGLRGLTGAGNNRINPAVVRRTTQGFANYINKMTSDSSLKKVAIAYDSRTRSPEFALTAAQVLCANGIRVYLFDSYQTTPCLSFAVRELNCIGGLCVTASHNPPEYHGYKVYWNDGAQITHPQDSGIIQEMFKLSGWDQDLILDEKTCRDKGLLESVPSRVIDSYYTKLESLSFCSEHEIERDLKIVYTPLHGTGALPTREMMKRLKFQNLFIVPEQEHPNGTFFTVKKPNPEEPAALKMAIDLAQKMDADICLANDPDSDRLALIVKDSELSKSHFASQSFGDFILLDGNQTGALLIDFILDRRKVTGLLKPTDAIVKTIVTSELLRAICNKFNVRCFDTLTGFKWIGALIRKWEQEKSDNVFLFGTEESFGYMPGSYVRDKDGIGALCQAVEMCAFLKKQGLTCTQKLLQIFEEHGAWKEDLISYDLEGESGALRIKSIMGFLRTNPPSQINGQPLVCISDYLESFSFQVNNQTLSSTRQPQKVKIDLPQSDVLQFNLSDGSKISMRPSGTEPKLKIYVSICTKSGSGAQVDFKTSVSRIIEIRADLKKMIESIP